MQFTKHTLITLALGFAAFHVADSIPVYEVAGSGGHQVYDPTHRQVDRGYGGDGSPRGTRPHYTTDASEDSDSYSPGSSSGDEDGDCDEKESNHSEYGQHRDNGKQNSYSAPLAKRAGPNDQILGGVIRDLFGIKPGEQGILNDDPRRAIPSAKKPNLDSAPPSTTTVQFIDEDLPELKKRSTLLAVGNPLDRLAEATDNVFGNQPTDNTLVFPFGSNDIDRELNEGDFGITQASNGPELKKREMNQDTEECEEAAPSNDHHWEYMDQHKSETPSYDSASHDDDQHDDGNEDCETGEAGHGNDASYHWKKQESMSEHTDSMKGWTKHGQHWQKVVRKVDGTGQITYFKIIKMVVPLQQHKQPYYPAEWHEEEQDYPFEWTEECDSAEWSQAEHHAQGDQHEEGKEHSTMMYNKSMYVKQAHYVAGSHESYSHSSSDGPEDKHPDNGDYSSEEENCEEDPLTETYNTDGQHIDEDCEEDQATEEYNAEGKDRDEDCEEDQLTEEYTTTDGQHSEEDQTSHQDYPSMPMY